MLASFEHKIHNPHSGCEKRKLYWINKRMLKIRNVMHNFLLIHVSFLLIIIADVTYLWNTPVGPRHYDIVMSAHIHLVTPTVEENNLTGNNQI